MTGEEGAELESADISASLFARAIFSLSVSLPALLSDRERVGVSASGEAIEGGGEATGDAAANSASRFCRAIFSFIVSFAGPELPAPGSASAADLESSGTGGGGDVYVLKDSL